MADTVAPLPTTPFRQSKQRKSHYPSPAFSNYFSDDDHSNFSPTALHHPSYTAEMSSSPAHSTSSTHATHTSTYFDSPFPDKSSVSPVQMALVERLQNLSTQLYERHLDDHNRMALELKLNELERALIAPDVQSRESAEGSDSLLFQDDEDEDNVRHNEMIADYEAQLKQSEMKEYALQARMDALLDRIEGLQDAGEDRQLQIHDRDVIIQSLQIQNVDLVKSLRAANENLLKLAIKVAAIDLVSSESAKRNAAAIELQEQQAVSGAESAHDEDDGHIDLVTTVVVDKQEDNGNESSENEFESDEELDYEAVDVKSIAAPAEKRYNLHTTPNSVEPLNSNPPQSINDPAHLSPWAELWQGLGQLFGGARDDDE